jgi:hypothetical protein
MVYSKILPEGYRRIQAEHPTRSIRPGASDGMLARQEKRQEKRKNGKMIQKNVSKTLKLWYSVLG